jgi:methyl-accepting chemotaxis protein
VVADEVRKLAERSSTQTTAITRTVTVTTGIENNASNFDAAHQNSRYLAQLAGNLQEIIQLYRH